jgi:hypothetical protein
VSEAQLFVSFSANANVGTKFCVPLLQTTFPSPYASDPATPSSVTDLGSYLSLHPGLQTEIQKAKEACVGQRTKVPSQTLRVLLREEIDW